MAYVTLLSLEGGAPTLGSVGGLEARLDGGSGGGGLCARVCCGVSFWLCLYTFVDPDQCPWLDALPLAVFRIPCLSFGRFPSFYTFTKAFRVSLVQ